MTSGSIFGIPPIPIPISPKGFEAAPADDDPPRPVKVEGLGVGGIGGIGSLFVGVVLAAGVLEVVEEEELEGLASEVVFFVADAGALLAPERTT